MKKVVYNIGFIILGMCFALQSCSDIIHEEPNPVPPEGDELVPISLDFEGLTSVDTYGTDYDNVTDTAGSTVENYVNDIIVYIFDNTYTCEKILSGPSSPIGPEMVKVGTKHFIAVVNAQANVPSLYPIPTTPSAVSYPALRKQLSGALTLLPSSPFLMVGEKLNVPITSQVPSSNPYRISIDVERVCAKVTMSFTKSALATSHNITINKITLHKGANKVYLFDKPDTDDITYTLKESKNTFTGVPPGEVENYPNYISLTDSFYTYAVNCGTDTTNAVRFEIEAAINSPANVRTAKFFLAEYINSSNDTLYDIKRNYWYDIKVNMADPGMDSVYITVNACPWNVADTIHEIVGQGGEATTPNPFKLVKSYSKYELDTYGYSYAAIDKHTKGTSWVDLLVSDGTTWDLKLKDNTARNQNVIGSTDGGTTWITLSNSTYLSGTGTDSKQRVYIYRPYMENAEPELGPALYLEIGGKYKQDLIIQPRDTTPIPTNSYIMRPRLSGTPANETRAYIPLAGVYRYWEDYLLDNGDSIPNESITANVLWQDRSGTIGTVSVINKDKRDSAYIYVEAGSVQGNAVVAMRVGTGPSNIYWSFHIWVTEYNPYEAAGQILYAGAPIKNIFMDRNLGALSNQYDATGEAIGLYYQFGRKDPFPRGQNWGNTFMCVPSSAISTSSALTAETVKLRPLTAIPTSLKTPTTFYTNTTWPLQQENDSLWITNGGNKTAFDPCPEGWRIPKQDVLSSSPWGSSLTTGNFVYDLNAFYLNGRYRVDLGYYPVSGYISSGTSITMDANSTTYYWTAWPGSTTDGTGLSISKTTVSTSQSFSNYYGNQVRCVVDVNYLISTGGNGLFGNSAGSMESEILP